jgi:hypothetical protein
LFPIARDALTTPVSFVPIRPMSSSEDGIPDERDNAVALLGAMGPAAHEAAGEIAKLLSNDDHLLRIYCIRALGKIGNRSPEVLEALERTSRDTNAYLAHEAKKTLEALKESK